MPQQELFPPDDLVVMRLTNAGPSAVGGVVQYIEVGSPASSMTQMFAGRAVYAMLLVVTGAMVLVIWWRGRA